MSLPGATHRHLKETDSTNAEARRFALAGGALPHWITADCQTAAYGRRGRPWTMGNGNFAGSRVSAVESATAAALRSFTTALALKSALEDLGTAPQDLTLKWPNDVLYREAKLAGILLETVPLPNPAAHALALITGIGVNLREAPAALRDATLPAIALDGRITPADLLPPLAAHMTAWENILETQGFPTIRDAWLAHAARLQSPVTARLPNETLTGRFEGMDEQGAIILDTATGRRHIAAADISF